MILYVDLKTVLHCMNIKYSTDIVDNSTNDMIMFWPSIH